jgi:ABC-type sugar transport system ATPase subunit
MDEHELPLAGAERQSADELLLQGKVHGRDRDTCQIAALQRRLGVTTVDVTHDQVEAMTMGDRVAVLQDGVLQQCASPRELFTRPADLFVAGFIGSPAMNLLPAKMDEDGAMFGPVAIPLTSAQRSSATSELVTVGIRGVRPGDRVNLVPDQAEVHVFDTVTGLRLAEAA